MSALSPDELSIPAAGAARSAELARVGTVPLDERRRAFDCERKRRTSAKAPPAASQQAPPILELRAFSPIVTALSKIMSVRS
jgi:hypothetical protein